MHNVEVTVPKGKGEQVARLALDCGISEATVSEVYAYGPNTNKETVKVQSDTPSRSVF